MTRGLALFAYPRLADMSRKAGWRQRRSFLISI